MNKKGLSITIIFKAQSLNYGEGIGNISELKKLTRGDGNTYTFASRQAIRYDIVRIGHKLFDWNLNVVDNSKKTIQFSDEYSINDSVEMDLFGYLKTKKSSKENADTVVRSAPVRLSNAISLEEYKSDVEFLSNKGLADRINEYPNLANIEQHLSYYTYTITIDLEKIGIDGEVNLSNEEKIKRVNELLEIIKVLNREIRGREENLSPLFVIGGMYNINTPFFLGRIKLDGRDGEFSINTDMLKDASSLKVGEECVYNDTNIGIVKGEFRNEKDIDNEFNGKISSIEEFFSNLENQVKEYYK